MAVPCGACLYYEISNLRVSEDQACMGMRLHILIAMSVFRESSIRGSTVQLFGGCG